ncbi:sulfatase, partial [uncultured Gimesia sp.]|uniref:sulfatase n=1 Tax=uncultured Gimesia sp. TaxID=1678688 RepID=UPI002602C55E
ENQELHAKRQQLGNKKKGPAWEAADVPDNAYMDGVLTEKAIETLQKLNKQEQPFFLAVGFFKPHLPFIAPQKYWDLYDHDKIQLPENYKVPQDAPEESIHNFGELRAYAGIPPKGPVTEETARNLIHGYYACVSYTDAQIGKLLAELDRLKLSDNTIVVLWGDHGWNLGDHTLWCKHSCYESSLQIPLIVRGPGIKGGQRRTPLIESIDVYPSLCDLTGIPQPAHLKGQSFVGLMRDPDIKWKQAAVSRYKNGDTIRTDQFRYSEYTLPKGKLTSRMLYDHTTDPKENVNVSQTQTDAVRDLSEQLNQLKGRNRKPGKK